MKLIKVSAPGKLHLLGEHAVVYGKPAIIAAIGKRCFVYIKNRSDKKINISSESFGKSNNFTEKEIIDKTKKAQLNWEKYIENNDILLLKSITSDPLDFPAIIIGESLRYFKKKISSGFDLKIKSDIPIGSGMGSSAALSVAIAGGISIFLGEGLNKNVINEIAFKSEQKKHGFPSGGDNSASCFGGMIWYRKESPDLKIIQKIPFEFPAKLSRNFYAIHTGIPSESTGEMVSIVRNLHSKRKNFVDGILSNQERLVVELLSAVKREDELEIINIIKNGERNLEKLGVVSDSAKLLIRSIEKNGEAAKICVAGGKKKGAGIVLVYSKHTEFVKSLAKFHNYKCINIYMGEEGFRKE